LIFPVAASTAKKEPLFLNEFLLTPLNSGSVNIACADSDFVPLPLPLPLLLLLLLLLLPLLPL